MISICEGPFADHMPMIVGPTPNFWVELINQIGSRHAKPSFNRCSDAVQKGFDILLGRLDAQFPVRVAAHVLSEEIEAFLYVRNDGLLERVLALVVEGTSRRGVGPLLPASLSI